MFQGQTVSQDEEDLLEIQGRTESLETLVPRVQTVMMEQLDPEGSRDGG